MSIGMSSLTAGRSSRSGVRIGRTFIATVVRVRLPKPEAGRDTLVVDVISDAERRPVFGCVFMGVNGVGQSDETYPRAAARDLLYPEGDLRRTLPTDAAQRLAVMAAAPSCAGWDGDKVLVAMVGSWPIVVGWKRHPRTETDFEPCKWTSGPAALPEGAELDAQGSLWIENADPLPAVHRARYKGSRTRWLGAFVETIWQRHGVAQEIRKVDQATGRVLSEVLAHWELTRVGALLNVQKFETLLKGARALLVDTAIPAGMDAVVTHAHLVSVIERQQAQIDELRSIATTLRAALTTACTAGATSATVPQVAAVFGTLGLALPAVPLQPGPTPADKSKMAAKNVRAAAQ